MRFRGILRSGDVEKLDTWLDEAQSCGLKLMQRFARTVSQDLEAVRNAATERLRIPTEASRVFRGKPAGDSNGSQPPIPRQTSHP
jgi:hypothetical protein